MNDRGNAKGGRTMRIGLVMLIAAVVGMSVAAEAGVRTINPKSFYPEGPLWHDGKLFYVESRSLA